MGRSGVCKLLFLGTGDVLRVGGAGDLGHFIINILTLMCISVCIFYVYLMFLDFERNEECIGFNMFFFLQIYIAVEIWVGERAFLFLPGYR